MPCRWHEKQIVVLENVIIDDPYTVERARSQDMNALKRVKQVVCPPLPPRLPPSSPLTPTPPYSSRESEENSKQPAGRLHQFQLRRRAASRTIRPGTRGARGEKVAVFFLSFLLLYSYTASGESGGLRGYLSKRGASYLKAGIQSGIGAGPRDRVIQHHSPGLLITCAGLLINEG